MTVLGPFYAGRERIRGLFLVCLITLVDAASSAWFGYNQGVWAGVVISPDFMRVFPGLRDANVLGFTTGCYLLGAGLGSVCAFLICDRLGRRRTIFLGHVLNTVGGLLQVFSWSLPQMIVGRCINGFGMGLTSSASPVLLAECTKSHLRGKLLAVGTSCNVTGFCLAGWVNFGFFFRDGPISWRFPLALPLVFPFVAVPLLLVLPESPRWLLLMGRESEALHVISRLAGPGTSEDDPDVVAQFRSIKGALRLEREQKMSFNNVLRGRDKTQNLRRLLLGAGAQLMQQFTGINALGFYLPILLVQSVGFDDYLALLLTAVNGTVYVFSLYISMLVIDKVGRRKLMLGGGGVLGMCHLVTAICVMVAAVDESNRRALGIVATTMIILFHFLFGPTFGTTPWVYGVEVSSLAWRARGAAVSTATNWTMGFVTVQFTKAGVDNLGWKFYLMFAIFCFAIMPIVYFFYPETARRTLEDMDHMFLMHPDLVVAGKHEMTVVKRPQALVDAEQQRISEEARRSSNENLEGRVVVAADPEKDGEPRR